MLIDILGRIFLNIMLIVALYVIEDKKIKISDKKFWISLVVINLLSFTFMSLKIVEIKPFLNVIILILTDVYILRSRLSSSVIKTIIIYCSLLLMEAVIVLFVMLVFDAFTINELNMILDEINEVGIYSTICNVAPLIILVLTFKNKFINDIYNKMLMVYNKINSKKNLLIVSSIFIFLILTYAVLRFSENLILNIIMLIVLVFITSIIYFKDLKVRFEYDETKEKYSSIRQSMVEYEEMIDKYRISNHENKNQLLIIQNMINNKDKKVNEYINNLVGNVYMNNEKMMMEVSIIPAGGLRATIHTKLNVMDNKDIKYHLNIDRKLRTVDFDNINSELNLKICKIISIYIDNAIDEVNTHKDEKMINIDMYIDDGELVIEVSNRFKNKFDVNRIFEKRYTTKENGHGYGLAIVQELIANEETLTNSTKIEDDIITQIVQIRLKK